MNSPLIRWRRRARIAVGNAWDATSATLMYSMSSRRMISISLALVFACALFVITFRSAGSLGHFEPWAETTLPPPHGHIHRHFKRARDQELYIYSAIANPHHPVSREVNIVFTVMDKARSRNLYCCVLLDHSVVYTAPVEKYYYYSTVDLPILADLNEHMHPDAYLARQYTCVMPESGHKVRHATLTSSTCSTDSRDYLPVFHPKLVPGGLALCGKIAYGGALDPEKLIEWFEVQKKLGVDKVVIYNLNNPEPIMKVFRHYEKSGFLNLQPYELPGWPYNRTMDGKFYYQWQHDKSLAVLECGQRMAGYTYVLSHDMDEFLIPRWDTKLKPFFNEKMIQHPDSAGFYFFAEFFLYDWGPTNRREDMMITRYRKATKPHWECTKFVMMPSRVISITTHHIAQMSGYSTYKISPEEAVLHHYRVCPSNVWKTCKPVNTIIDDTMIRYKDIYPKVLDIRKELELKVSWDKKRV